MSETELVSLIEEILEAPAGSVTPDSDLEDLGWDSLSNLSFIAIADDRYGRTVDPQDLARAETPSDLAELLGASARP